MSLIFKCGELLQMDSRRGSSSARYHPPGSGRPWWKRHKKQAGAVVIPAAGVLVGAWFLWIAGPPQSAPPASPGSTESSTAAPPTALTSGPGLSVNTTMYYIGGQDTTFVTKNGFEPSGQLLALMEHAVGNPKLFPMFRDAGAIQAGTMILRFVLTGESSQGIRILNMTPIIVTKGPPWHGDLFAAPNQGSPSNLQALLNFDESFPTVRSGYDGRPYFQERTITLRPGEQEIIIMQVTSNRAYYAFKLKVDYLVGSQARSLTLTDQPGPFEISGFNCTGNNAWASYDHSFALNGLAQYVPTQEAIQCPPH